MRSVWSRHEPACSGIMLSPPPSSHSSTERWVTSNFRFKEWSYFWGHCCDTHALKRPAAGGFLKRLMKLQPDFILYQREATLKQTGSRIIEKKSRDGDGVRWNYQVENGKKWRVHFQISVSEKCGKCSWMLLLNLRLINLMRTIAVRRRNKWSIQFSSNWISLKFLQAKEMVGIEFHLIKLRRFPDFYFAQPLVVKYDCTCLSHGRSLLRSL